MRNFGAIDILINGAGGNKAEATTSDYMSFFDIPSEAIQWVFNLNVVGTVLPTQVFGKVMAEKGEGVIINMSSMAAPAADSHCCLLCGQGRSEQFHSMDGYTFARTTRRTSG